ATYSWDWGRFDCLSRPGAGWGALRQLFHRKAVPIIVLHPADLERGHVHRALELIQRLQDAGRQLVGVERLVERVNAGSPL
ncbi:MAG: hypothetical protein ACKV0T_06080, partial [Planctomycetales bacterium]